MIQPWRLAVPLKRLGIFLLVAGIATILYNWAIRNLGLNSIGLLSIIVIWILTAYYLLPLMHRFLTRVYVPNYFIGRSRTADGLLADPVNLSVRGSKADLKRAMWAADWHEADPLNVKTGIWAIKTTLQRHSYPNAPVSDLFVFGRKHDMAFQREVDGNPAKRHHVRFWRVEKKVYLPGGYDVDWVAAATYDDAVGISFFSLQITHSIDGDVDAERDFLVQTLQDADALSATQNIAHFFPQYEHRNAHGDKFFTNGSMVIVDLKKLSKT